MSFTHADSYRNVKDGEVDKWGVWSVENRYDDNADEK